MLCQCHVLSCDHISQGVSSASYQPPIHFNYFPQIPSVIQLKVGAPNLHDHAFDGFMEFYDCTSLFFKFGLTFIWKS